MTDHSFHVIDVCNYQFYNCQFLKAYKLNGKQNNFKSSTGNVLENDALLVTQMALIEKNKLRMIIQTSKCFIRYYTSSKIFGVIHILETNGTNIQSLRTSRLGPTCSATDRNLH